jgi:hypothetical protein
VLAASRPTPFPYGCGPSSGCTAPSSSRACRARIRRGGQRNRPAAAGRRAGTPARRVSAAARRRRWPRSAQTPASASWPRNAARPGTHTARGCCPSPRRPPEPPQPVMPEIRCAQPVQQRRCRGRRAPPQQGTATDIDGHRVICLATDARTGQVADLELRHRRRARCEDRIVRHEALFTRRG